MYRIWKVIWMVTGLDGYHVNIGLHIYTHLSQELNRLIIHTFKFTFFLEFCSELKLQSAKCMLASWIEFCLSLVDSFDSLAVALKAEHVRTVTFSQNTSLIKRLALAALTKLHIMLKNDYIIHVWKCTWQNVKNVTFTHETWGLSQHTECTTGGKDTWLTKSRWKVGREPIYANAALAVYQHNFFFISVIKLKTKTIVKLPNQLILDVSHFPSAGSQSVTSKSDSLSVSYF